MNKARFSGRHGFACEATNLARRAVRRVTAGTVPTFYPRFMSHPYVKNYFHLVFSTKNRRPFIKPPHSRDLHDQLRYVAVSYGASIDALGGTENHVHILLQLPPKLAIAAIVAALKAKSSKWMNDHGHLFACQAGYGCFTVSSSNVAEVRTYINAQDEHHRQRSFDDEFEAILRKHGIVHREDGSFENAKAVPPAKAGS